MKIPGRSMQKVDSAAKICSDFLKNQTNFGRFKVLVPPCHEDFGNRLGLNSAKVA